MACALPGALRLVFEQRGDVLPHPRTGKEHFGFCDDISQPAVRGLLADGSLLTPRMGALRTAAPHRIWPGEFIFGYPAQHGVDRLRPGPVARGGPPWTHNGSLLVFRRLRQDSAAFERFLRQAAATLSRKHPSAARAWPDVLRAKLMGRWPSGAPLMHHPRDDAPEHGTRNDFGYGDDPLGLVCPRAAHIRRAYPRDAATSSVTEANVETHRLLRRSIPFVDRRGGFAERGLLFLAYQTSIERQFEFVTRAWLNNPHLHETDDGHDPIAGQPFGARGDRTRCLSLPVVSDDGTVERVKLELRQEWVVPTGGGYFFAPSVTALRELGR
jgi:Dyp-type peroxidase family